MLTEIFILRKNRKIKYFLQICFHCYRKSIKSEKKKIFLLNEQNKEENIDEIEEKKLNINIENRDSEMIFREDKFLREIPKQSDVTSTLRKLNKDAINAIVRRNRIQIPLEVSDKPIHCKNCKTIVKLAPTNISSNIDDDSDASSLENIKTVNFLRIYLNIFIFF